MVKILLIVLYFNYLKMDGVSINFHNKLEKS